MIENSTFMSNFAKNKGSDYYGIFSVLNTEFTNVNIVNSSAVSSIFGENVAINAKNLHI